MAAVLNMPALTTAQYQALQYYFANGGKLSGAQIGTRNFLAMMPGQQTPIDGDRNRDKLRASLNWQANEKLSLTAGYDYNRDNYNNTTAGLKDGKTSTWNLDATFAISETVSSSVFYTNQDRRLTTAGPGTGTNADGTAAATRNASEHGGRQPGRQHLQQLHDQCAVLAERQNRPLPGLVDPTSATKWIPWASASRTRA